jgi:hypothetical protein
MGPDKKSPEEKIDSATLSNLKDEGIEIETESRHIDENEFSPETDSVSAKPQVEEVIDEETKTILAEIAEPATKSPTPEIAPSITPSYSTPPVTKPAAPILTPEPRVTPLSSSANDPSIHQLRTFRMDAEEAVKYHHVSASDIAIAEQKKRESTPIEYSNENRLGLTFIITTVVMLLALVGTGTYFYLRTQRDNPTKSATGAIRSIIPYEKIISITEVSEENLLARIANKAKDESSTVGSIAFIAIPDTATTTRQVPIALALAGSKIPEKLLRSLTNEYMFGVHTFDGKAPFIILKTSFFQNAFPGMLEWEKEMRNGLLPLIQVGRPGIEAVTTNSDIFVDRVMSNKDVRELRGTNGNPIILYTFTDKNTILITTNEKSLRELVNKLLAIRVIQ